MSYIALVLPWPPAKSSPNSSHQGDWRGKASAGKAYKRQCAQECMAQGVRRMDAVAVRVTLEFNPPTSRAFDLDNALAKAKRGLDALSEMIGVDDSQWLEMRLLRGPKVTGGQIKVVVEGVDG